VRQSRQPFSGDLTGVLRETPVASVGRSDKPASCFGEDKPTRMLGMLIDAHGHYTTVPAGLQVHVVMAKRRDLKQARHDAGTVDRENASGMNRARLLIAVSDRSVPRRCH